MSVFADALANAGGFLRDAAIAGAHELGVFGCAGTVDEIADAVGVGAGRRRLRALLDALVALGVITREGARYVAADVPMAVVPREGWGRIAEVIRTDQALVTPADNVRYQRHLLVAGADTAREVAAMVGTGSLLDLGGGAGTYTAAFLDAHPAATATLVDLPEVAPLARDHLARFGERARVVAGDARQVTSTGFDIALVSNVLHVLDPEACAGVCRVAAAAADRVVIVELMPGTLTGALFALNMAVYTDGGDVYGTEQLARWLADAGCVDIEAQTLPGDMVVVRGVRSRRVGERFARGTGLVPADTGDVPLPAPLHAMLGHALALEGDSERAAQLRTHYLDAMPAARAAQISSDDPLLHTPLDWTRLPRLTAALDRFDAALAGAGVRRRAPRDARTVAELYGGTHYGQVMPLLYGNPADLAYFRRAEGDVYAAIDRYLTTPILHELCHGAPDRDALMPLHLDECIAGWLGVHVHPEFAYPREGDDNAIYAAPWLAQVGQAFARAFGIDAVIRAHTGEVAWDRVVPPAILDAVVRRGWDDWVARRSLHFLADTLDPDPWVALALSGGVADDPAFDRRIVEDALRAMCLDNARIDGSFRARTRLPDEPIRIDARHVTTPRRGDVDTIDPRYWVPPAVAARIPAGGYTLALRALGAIPEVAALVCAGAGATEHASFTLAVG